MHGVAVSEGSIPAHKPKPTWNAIRNPTYSAQDMLNAITHPDREKFQDCLNQNHFAMVPSVIARQELESAAADFLAFLDLPSEIKQLLHFPVAKHRATPDGYTDRTNWTRKDPKQFFHWTPSMKGRNACVALQAQNAVVARFLLAAEGVYRCAEATLNTVFTYYLPAYRERIFAGDQLIDGTLRFLCYLSGADGTHHAQAHYDKGFSTLALGDSAPGLRIGCDSEHPLFPVQHRNSAAVFMPGWMLFQVSDGQIKPAWHDVRPPTGQSHVSRSCARWSIVFFVNDPEGQFSAWDTVHTPLH